MQLYPGQVPHLLLQVTKSQTIKAILSLLSCRSALSGFVVFVFGGLFVVEPKKQEPLCGQHALHFLRSISSEALNSMTSMLICSGHSNLDIVSGISQLQLE